MKNQSVIRFVKLEILISLVSALLCGCRISAAAVHTRDGMKDFAVTQLKAKYSRDFVLEEDTLCFSDNSDNSRLTNDLSGFAHVINTPDERTYFIVEEPDVFKDNYSFHQYRKPVQERVEEELKAAGLDASVEPYYSVITGKLPDNLSVEEIIADPKCEICFTVTATDIDAPEDCLPMIREWMRYLYSLDYDWYFELVKGEQVIYSLDQGDGGSCETDWTDAEILRHMNLD